MVQNWIQFSYYVLIGMPPITHIDSKQALRLYLKKSGQNAMLWPEIIQGHFGLYSRYLCSCAHSALGCTLFYKPIWELSK